MDDLFNERLPEGTAAERRVARTFLMAGISVRLQGDGNAFDLSATIGQGPELIEVKNEDRYAESPNVCVELWQNDGKGGKKPSGLAVTESTVMVHTFGEVAVLYRTRDMRLEGKRQKWQAKDFPKADRGNGGWLVEKAWLRQRRWADECPIANLPKSAVLHGSRHWKYYDSPPPVEP